MFFYQLMPNSGTVEAPKTEVVTKSSKPTYSGNTYIRKFQEG